MTRPDLDDLHLVRPTARCPACGRREARFLATWRLLLYRGIDPDLVVETVTCSRSSCRELYPITVGDYQKTLDTLLPPE